MADRYLVPRRLDDPEVIGFWTIDEFAGLLLSLIHISEPTRPY